MPKIVDFGEFLKNENIKLAVKQCYQTGIFKQDKNWWKIPMNKNPYIDSNFIQYVYDFYLVRLRDSF